MVLGIDGTVGQCRGLMGQWDTGQGVDGTVTVQGVDGTVQGEDGTM